MHQLLLSGSGVEHDQRPDPRAGQEETSGLRSYKSIKDVVKKTRNTRFRDHLFNTTVLAALTYALETWASKKKTW
ncbi:hypothetical protein RB195_009503 [Necator americanus]|uniref:Transposase n=1 Tax=Necator americanus TaxID=51031 RepID=A0ABR1CTL1_NECAM